MLEAAAGALSAPRRVASWRLPDAHALERVAAWLVAAARAAGRPGVVWLDSGGPTLSRGSESVLTAFPVERLRLARDEAAEVPSLLAQMQAVGPPGVAWGEGSGPRFCGGWLGFLGYEAAAGLEPVRLATPADLPVPLASWGLYPTWLRHAVGSGRLELWTRSKASAGAPAALSLDAWRDGVEAAIASPRGVPGVPGAPGADPRFASRLEAESWVEAADRSFTRSGFEAAVGAVQAAVREGEMFQANIAHRLRVPTAVDPFAVYLVLRRLNPSPFALFLEEDWGALASNSPERLFAVRRDATGRSVEARPIAGTRPRGATPAEDVALAVELSESAKERAEHSMLVDLARNDVARVAAPGSVRVAAFQWVEAYSHVHHLVSRVVGRVRPGVGLVELARAFFPGGTITGAPKLRSMEVIDRVEPVARGPYTGSAGYVNPDGSLDWNILIRTLIFLPGVACAYAGAGIVADSVPEREYEETLHKAAAMLVALATLEHAGASRRVPLAVMGGPA